jgi:hypothetical protein
VLAPFMTDTKVATAAINLAVGWQSAC